MEKKISYSGIWITNAQAIIVSTAIIHNIAQEKGEPEPPIDADVEEAFEELELDETEIQNNIGNANVRQILIDTYFERYCVYFYTIG